MKRTGKAGSTVFLKTLMAVTGIIFVLFVLAHMYGNLKLFFGEQSFNDYSEGLRTLGEPELPRHGLLTILEIILGVSVVLHIYSAIALWKRAQHARPVRYTVKKRVAASISSKWMRWGGVFLALFIVWHLLEFTLVRINVGSGGQVAGITQNPYELVVHSFQVWWLTVIYLVAMVALFMHLNHGIWSASQTLGWTSTPSARVKAKAIALVVALVVSIGFAICPFFVLVGVIS
ncbi:succinate dehydrogenase cytochrome b subunit [Leekyejoonella antrihumi]|uniref:succinate dehydrogenase cytochrome b subunit n=1 Tax=Leekyejoonella antrihumi TaxID=1660198 RepID=UPI001FECD14E|nr:succinate dehydrogenase cytochrome b subunit [Leekyejoonella antrihumi]